MRKKTNLAALCLLLVSISVIMSCKKVVDSNNSGGTTTGSLDTANSTARDRMYDSMYFYALQTYYWNTDLPTYDKFLPRQYENANDSLGLANEQYAYTRYAKDASGDLYEQRIEFDPNTAASENDNSSPKFSYVEYTSESENGGSSYVPYSNSLSKLKAFTLDGKDSSFGFVPGFVSASDTYDSLTAQNQDSAVGIIRYVITGSPADKAGLRRGDVILKYNGEALNYDNNLSAIESALFDNPSLTLSVYDPYKKDTIDNISLQSKLYTFNPIFKSEVLTYGSHKIAYLAFFTFSDPTTAKPLLDSAFKSYANQGATDIVVDLRYNGGGYVETAEDLVDYIAPSSSNGQTMYTAYYNQMMTNGQAPILKNILADYDDPSQGNLSQIDFSPTAQTTKVNKAGSVGSLTKVYFIVSSGTASASELVINSLKPYVSETQISADFSDTSSFTYGKPVGFFEIRMGQFSEWTPNFEMKNASGAGGYYQGLKSDYDEFDDIMHDFGDPQEYCLADMIYLISGINTYQSSARTANSLQRSLSSMVMKAKSIGNVYKISDMVGKPKRVFKTK